MYRTNVKNTTIFSPFRLAIKTYKRVLETSVYLYLIPKSETFSPFYSLSCSFRNLLTIMAFDSFVSFVPFRNNCFFTIQLFMAFISPSVCTNLSNSLLSSSSLTFYMPCACSTLQAFFSYHASPNFKLSLSVC